MSKELFVVLRHGWGCDMKRRERVLEDRKALEQEVKAIPIKYSDSAIPFDLKLFNSMQKQKKRTS